MKKLIKKILPVADVLLLPLTFMAAWLLKGIRKAGINNLPCSKKMLINIGVFPIIDHYYEPQFDNRKPSPAFSEDRKLTGIDWDISGQLSVLEKLQFSSEFECMPQEKTDALEFYFKNSSFESGDAEFWYQMIRAIKPQKIFEIGSGHSTLMAMNAINKNQKDEPDYKCEHVCIEPYEMPWLDKSSVSVIREKVEDVELSFFSKLQANDILFIDSSHMIRPQGDVLFEYLELLPTLNKGVIVHIHDIFSPKNYPKSWLDGDVKFWNEQYILEAFLTNNKDWKIIGALNFLHHNYPNEFKHVAPFVLPEREPGSFYIQKVI